VLEALMGNTMVIPPDIPGAKFFSLSMPVMYDLPVPIMPVQQVFFKFLYLFKEHLDVCIRICILVSLSDLKRRQKASAHHEAYRGHWKAEAMAAPNRIKCVTQPAQGI